MKFEASVEDLESNERNKIELIEQSPLDYRDKEDILLVYLKAKPSGIVYNDARFKKTIPKNKKEELLESLSSRKNKIIDALEKIKNKI